MGRLRIQLGGAAGTLASLGADGLQVRRALGEELGLSCGDLPWQSDRQMVAEVGSATALACAAGGKIGRDVSLLSMAEIAEVVEPAAPARGGSSTLPQKRNPVLSALLLANARRAPALGSILLGALDTELERSPGAWQSEWQTVTELLQICAGSARYAAELLAGLEVDHSKMAANLEASGGSVMAEHLLSEVSDRIGLEPARELVAVALGRSRAGQGFAEALSAEVERYGERLSGFDLSSALDPRAYLGSAGDFVDAVVARIRGRATARGSSSGS